jgi:hypothetical protein
VRRKPHSDKWSNSGGTKGSSTIWLTDTLRIRKRYGKFGSVQGHQAEYNAWESKFEEYTLLSGPHENPVEDKTAVVFVRAAVVLSTHALSIIMLCRPLRLLRTHLVCCKFVNLTEVIRWHMCRIVDLRRS